MLTSSHWGTYSVVVEDRIDLDKIRARHQQHKLRLTPFKDDPAPSLIGHSLAAAVADDLRIQQPVARASWLDAVEKDGAINGAHRRRRGRDHFVSLSWSDAFELVGQTLTDVIDKHGNQAIFGGSYGWASAGRFHHAQSQLHRFLNLIGGYTASVNTYSSGAAEVIVPHVLGYDYRTCNDTTTTWNLLARHTQLVVAFGGMAAKNAQVHPGGISRHLATDWLDQCAGSGTAFVNVSPVRADLSAQLNAEWLAIRPNTDTALMLALAHTLVTENLCDDQFVQRHCTGYPAVRDYLLGVSDGAPKTAAWAAAITDIEAEDIRTLARRMAGQRTFISLSLSIQRGDHGEQTYWAGITLAALLGQLGTPGGGIGFGYAALGGVGNPRSTVKGPTFPQGENPCESFIPVARLTDMLLEPGAEFDYNGQRLRYPDIKLVYWAGGNPFHHQQDLVRLSDAWQRPETVIAHEIWWNPLARHADIVLPATTPLERNDLGFNSSDENLIAMKQAVPPVGGARHDFDIFTGIAERLGCIDAFTEGRTELQWLESMYNEFRARRTDSLPTFEAFWAADSVQIPPAAAENIFLSDFTANPVQNPLPTPSGKIELFSETIANFNYADCPGHAAWFEPEEWLGSKKTALYPLHLLSNQPANRLHSQFDHGKLSQAGKVAGREALRMHPLDARARNIADGELVRIYNARGACLAGVVLTDDLRPGVVMLPTGAWFDPAHTPDGKIFHDRGGNPNLLTLDKGTSKLAQATSAQTALVEVERYAGPTERVQSYQPPDIDFTAPEEGG